MQLQDMKTDFLMMEDAERTAFVLQYTEQRRLDLEQATVKLKSKSKGGKKKAAPKTMKVTPEQLALMKKLGLV